MAPSEKTQRKVLELTKKQVCAIAACDYNTNLAEGDHKADLQQSLIDLMLQVTQCNQCGGQCCFSKHLFDVTKPPFAPAGGEGEGDDDDDDDDDEEQGKSRTGAAAEQEQVSWVGQKIAITILNTFYVVLCPMLPPPP